MLQIAICDDDPQELVRAETLSKQYAGEHNQYELKISTFDAPLELLTAISEKGGFDVLLLDIYMDGMLGTDAARELRNLGDKAEIIFLTTSRHHALTAFEVDAAQYLVKPYLPQDLFAALDKVLHRIAGNENKTFTLKTSAGITKLSTNEVVFTETSKNNYQTIHVAKGEPLLTRMTSLDLFALLSQDKSFVKCGASFNVNLKYVRYISKDIIQFDTGERLPIPGRIYGKLKDEFLSYQVGDTD